jgi:hypothetical protein
VHRRTDSWHRLILPHLENAFGSFHPGADARPGDEGVSERRIGEVDRQGIVEHVASSRGVIAQPSAPQFSSSQAVIWVCRWPRPSGGTSILIRTGKRRSADVIMSRWLPGMDVRSLFVCRYPSPEPCPAAWVNAPAHYARATTTQAGEVPE